MNILTAIIIGIVLTVCAFGMVSCTINSDTEDITAWVQSQEETSIKIEFRVLDIGPYFHMKNARYYRVQTNKNVYWVKYMWGRTIKKEVGHKYETID